MVDLPPQLHLGGHEAHRRLGRRRRTTIRHQLDDRRIRFVPDRRHERQHGRQRGVGDDPLVEGPEVLHRAAPSCDEDRVHAEAVPVRIHPADGPGHHGRSALPLHAGVDDEQPDRRTALAGRGDHVLDRRRTRRGDDGHAARQERQGTFARLLEVPGGAQLRTERAKALLQGAGADRLELRDVELGASLRRVEADVPGGHDRIAVGRPEAEAPR